ncbi:transmembrane protein 199-like [Acanthaster planci]|uniref:Transmembrane protein 199-like n=1 Tax=Acanthaster planci TaxID=133434 RepID=A0A8B7ZD82_ACAPL|nr:transmembrane protein 199-like [Acanthaster planci]
MATLYVLTGRMYDEIDGVLLREDVPEDFKNELRGYAKLRKKENPEEEPSIPFSTLRKLHSYLGTDGKPGMYLHQLMQGTEVFFPPLPKLERNPELVARLERLRAEQANREYQEMTKNVSNNIAGRSPLGQVGKELKSVQTQLMGVFNVFLTIAGAFVFGFMAMYYAGQSVTARVLCGLAFALIVAAADLYFLIKNDL